MKTDVYLNPLHCAIHVYFIMTRWSGKLSISRPLSLNRSDRNESSPSPPGKAPQSEDVVVQPCDDTVT